MRPTIPVLAVVAVVVSNTVAGASVCETYRYSAPAAVRTPKGASTADDCRRLREAAIAELQSQYDAAVTARMKASDAQKSAESAVYRCTSDASCAAARDAWKKSQEAVAQAESRVSTAKLAPSQVGTCECSGTPIQTAPKPLPLAAKTSAKKTQRTQPAAAERPTIPAAHEEAATQKATDASAAVSKAEGDADERVAAVTTPVDADRAAPAAQAKTSVKTETKTNVAAETPAKGSEDARITEVRARLAAGGSSPSAATPDQASTAARASAADAAASTPSEPAPEPAAASAASSTVAQAEPAAPAAPPEESAQPAAPAAPAVAPVSLDGVTASESPYPSCLTQKINGASRFEDSKYFALMASDGLLSLPAKVISNRMKAAAERGETYKALFLARILSDQVPDNRAVWANRSALAGALGLAGEAAACGEKAQTPGAKVDIPSDVLPGRIAARPTTLADWAAALSMMADGVSQHEAATPVVAIKDDVSGIEPVIPDEQDAKPSARALPIHLEDIAPNAFVLRDAQAMFTKSMNKGQFAMMLLSAATMAYGSYNGVTQGLDQMGQVYGHSAAEAFSVASRFKDGSYTTRTWGSDVAPVDQKVKPRTAGESDAVDLPFPLLWASGGALHSSFFGRLATGHGKNAETEYWDAAAKKSRKVTPPDVSFPRLASVCPGQCSPPVTLQELLFDEEDLRVMFGDGAGALLTKVPDLAAARDAYARHDTEMKVAGMVQGMPLSNLIGYAGGNCYNIEMKPNAWIIAAPAAQSKRR